MQSTAYYFVQRFLLLIYVPVPLVSISFPLCAGLGRLPALSTAPPATTRSTPGLAMKRAPLLGSWCSWSSSWALPFPSCGCELCVFERSTGVSTHCCRLLLVTLFTVCRGLTPFNGLSPVSCLQLCSWILYYTISLVCTTDCRQCSLWYTHPANTAEQPWFVRVGTTLH